MIHDAIHYIGTHFTHEQYLFWSRVQGSLWTLADIVIAYYLIRIANLCRAYLGEPRRVVLYVILAATLPPAAFIPFVNESIAFFRLEVMVTVPHFLIMLWILIVDARRVFAAIRRRTLFGVAPRSTVC